MNAVADLRNASQSDTYEQVLRTVRCVAWRVRLPDFVTLYVSSNCEDVLGHPVDLWRNDAAWLERVHPEDRARVVDQLRGAMIAGQSFEREYRLLRPDGRTLWVHDTIGIVHDAAGEAVELQGMTFDVTDRRHREDALRFDRDRLKIAMDLAGVTSWEWHVDSDRMVTDPLGLPLIHERPLQNASSAEFLASVHPDDRGRVYDAAMRAVTRGEPFVDTFRIVRHDGRLRWIETSARPKGAPGHRHTLVGASRDVTEQVESTNEVRLRSLLFDSLGEGVSVVREDGTLVYVNAALERMFGYGPDELVGRNSRVLSSRSEAEYGPLFEKILAAVERDGCWVGTMHGRRRDGTVLQIAGTVTRVVVGGETLWVAVRRDVTERRQLQREVLAASQREKEALAHALHDGLGQQLTGIALLASTLRDDGERRGSPVAGSLRRLAELLQEAVGTCRRLAQGVSGFVVRHGGLQIGLRELALAYERRTEQPCDVDVDQAASDAIPPERARHLYWIAEDALNAAVQLGRPARARLELAHADASVRLRVSLSDLSPELLSTGAAPLVNLIGYRASLLGAGLATMPADEGGVILDILCPMEDGPGVMP